VEGDPEIWHSKLRAERIRLVGRCSSDILVRGGGRDPVEVLPHTLERFEFERLVELGA